MHHAVLENWTWDDGAVRQVELSQARTHGPSEAGHGSANLGGDGVRERNFRSSSMYVLKQPRGVHTERYRQGPDRPGPDKAAAIFFSPVLLDNPRRAAPHAHSTECAAPVGL